MHPLKIFSALLFRHPQHSGNIFAVLGLAICAIAGLARIFGAYYVLGFEAMSLFAAGTALLVAACLAKLQLILEK